MKQLFILTISILIILSCQSNSKSTDKKSNDIDSSFTQLSNRFIESLWKIYPSWASGLGNHIYDTVLIIPNEDNRNKELLFCKNYLDTFSYFNPKDLNESNKTDKALIENFLKSTQWTINQFKSYEWNPSEYNPGGSVADILNNKKEKSEIKVEHAIQKLKNIGKYYVVAKANIKNPTKEHTELAIMQLKGTIDYFATSLNDSIKKSSINENKKQELLNEVVKVNKSISDFVTYLDSLLKNTKNFRDFRIGKELYAEKFKYDIQSNYTSVEIYNKALKRKNELLNEMDSISKKLWSKYIKSETYPSDSKVAIKKLITAISKTHVERSKFQQEIERQIPILTEFVRKKDLLYLDPKKPLVVRKEPEWMAGVAGASISSPGPYDKEGDTFYNVGSLAAYSKDEAESFLREYNKYILQILNIHEAIPGHYAQLVYSNQSPSLIKSIFGNGAMIEGWAVYTERMMLEEGWAKNTELNGNVEEDEMWLMYCKWHMRVVCNTILDYSLHNLNMSKEEGLNLLMNEAFQEKAEAEGKWKRATLTQVQLCSYFTGYSEIHDLRETIKQKQGNAFDLKKFHERFLSFGSAPVSEIKQLMNN
jgi:uncharacterized protein (DUF885 family)